MSFTLYAATIPNNLQLLGAVAALITKAETWCNERGLPPDELMVQQPREARVPALGHLAGQLGGLLLLRVVMNVEVLGAEDLEIVGLVADLVAAEVLRLGVAADQRRQRGQQRHPAEKASVE